MRNYDWVRVLKLAFPYFFAVGLFQFISYLLLGLDIHQNIELTTMFQKTVVSLFGTAGTFLIIWIFCKYIDRNRLKDLGLDGLRIFDISLGLVMGFTIMLVSFFLLFICKQILFEKIQYKGFDFLLSVFLFLNVSFTEELLVRGYVLKNLLSSFNKYIALVVSALLFALMHIANPELNVIAFLNLFLAGVLLGLSYIYTKNLWFPIALHFSWNFFQGTLFGFNVSGLNFDSLIIQYRLENTIWNGGGFGFEGSILCGIFQIICISIIYRVFNTQSKEKSDLCAEEK